MFAPVIALCAWFASASPETPETSHLVDMVVAQVDSSVITFSELVSETRLVLLKTGGPELARAATLSQSLLSAVLRSMIIRELVLGEIRRLKLGDVPDKEVKAALELLRRRFVTPADFERFLERAGFSEPGAEKARDFDAPPSLVSVVKSDLLSEWFLDVRVGRNIVVRESDVATCWEANRALFENATLSDVAPRIRERLKEEQRDRAIETLVVSLERRASVRYTPGFEPPPREPDNEGGLRCPTSRSEPLP